jgi:magnesium transporter
MKKRGKSVKKVGAPPGTLVYTGNNFVDFDIEIIDYDMTHFKEIKVKNAEDAYPYKDKETTTWINIVGIHKIEAVEKIGKYFNLHPLVLEDILNINQRPKLDNLDNITFLVLKMLNYNDETQNIETEHISIVLGDKFVLTFQEKKGDVFEPVRQRIRESSGIIRKNGAEYLVYALIDVIVDNYFVIFDKIEGTVEDIESKVVQNSSPETVQTIHKLKKNLIELRKSIWPLREILYNLSKDESEKLKRTNIYFRDVYDHTIQIIEILETIKDTTSTLLDIYLTSVSNKMNEVMKVLTIIATIFIPLTFLAGVYGMNFKYMPELEWKFGYPAILLIMLFVGIGMVVYFKKKKWI